MVSIRDLKQEINFFMGWEGNGKINSFLKVFNIDLNDLFKVIYKSLKKFINICEFSINVHYNNYKITILSSCYNYHQCDDDFEFETKLIVKKFIKLLVNQIDNEVTYYVR